MPIKQITPDKLGGLIDRAITESWTELIILGPFSIFEESPYSKRWLYTSKQQVFRLTEPVDDLAAKIAPIRSLTSLHLSENGVGDEGVELIAQSLPALRSLSLDDNRIGRRGARAIGRSLTKLESLDLGNNRIGAEGAKAIAQSLTGLTWLDLRRNMIRTEGAKAIARSLTGLTSLDLGTNWITDEGAEAIAGSLAKLTWLNLRSNGIGNEGAKAIARSLPKLTSLSLGYNSVGAEGAKAIARSLTGLTWLDLWGNEIGTEGAKSILDTWSERPDVDGLRFLDLRDNRDLSALLPAEVLADPYDPAAILAAYGSFQAGNKTALNEAKLLVVGREDVGKTSLVRFLIEDEPRRQDEGRTAGIAKRERIETTHWSPEASEIKLTVWDFGGQEIMWGTHRFFLTPRSLYLLVLSDRQEDDRSIYSWLKTIRNRAAGSPILVVINKSDGGRQRRRLEETRLRKEYPEIVGFLRTSCNDDDYSKNSIQSLRERIVEIVANDPRLKHVHEDFPRRWMRIKEEVAALARERAVLRLADFQAICARGDDPDGQVRKDAERRFLLRLLNDLGIVVTHGLEPQARAVTREIALLDPNWLTQAVYRILEGADSTRLQGEFSEAHLRMWLDPEIYPPEHHEFILHMMQDEEIGLCFRLPDADATSYLVPEALSPEPYAFPETWPSDSLRFRFRYSLLPRSLVPRFIVRAHDLLAARPTRWLTGAVFKVANCQILVQADMGNNQLDIWVDGPPARRRLALGVIVDRLEAVHKLKPECEASAHVPLPDQPDIDVPFEHLSKLEERYGPDYEYHPPGARRGYAVHELLQGVRDERRIARFAIDERGRPSDMIDGDGDRPVRSEADGFAFWRRFALGVAVGAVGLFHLIYWIPDPEASKLIGISAAIFVLVYLTVTFFNPLRFWRRVMTWVIAAGLLINTANLAAEAFFQSGAIIAAFRMDARVHLTFNLAWVLIVAILAGLEWQQHKKD